MTKTQIIKKNIALSEKFSDYIMKNPKSANKIGAKARIVILPRDDEKLKAENLKIARNCESSGGVYIAQETSRGWLIRDCAK